MKKIALLAGACTLFYLVACGDDSSTSAAKNDSSNTAEVTPQEQKDQSDSGCTVKESTEGFDIICNGDSVDTIYDEETEQGTCHVKDTVNTSGNAGVRITCGDSTRVVWTATPDNDKQASSGKEKSSSSKKKETTEKSSSSVKSEKSSSSVKSENSSSSSAKTTSSSSVKSNSSSSSVKTASSSSEKSNETTSSDKAEDSSSSSSSEGMPLPPVQMAPAPDTLTCNSKKYTTDTAFCFRNRFTGGNYVIYKLCGGSKYSPDIATCDGGTIKVECGGTAYDTLQKVCLRNTLYPLTATEKGIEGVYIGANDTTYDSDNRIVSVKPVYFAKANLLLVKKSEGNYEGVVPASPGIISKGARVKYHNEMYYDIEADTLDLFVYADTSGYFYLTDIYITNDIAGNDAYDIARAKLGGKWRLPKSTEAISLYYYFRWGGSKVETIIDHHTVCDNHIDPIHKTEVAFPIAGVYNDTAFVNYTDKYRTSNYYYGFSSGDFNTYFSERRHGLPVRPVFTGD